MLILLCVLMLITNCSTSDSMLFQLISVYKVTFLICIYNEEYSLIYHYIYLCLHIANSELTFFGIICLCSRFKLCFPQKLLIFAKFMVHIFVTSMGHYKSRQSKMKFLSCGFFRTNSSINFSHSPMWIQIFFPSI